MVSVIIVSYNTKELTLKCLESATASKGVELELIVVDNGSADGSVTEIRKRYKNVKIIENKSNLGFGKANNQGMKIAHGDYILLLNSDCFVEPGTIRELLDKKYDVAGCKLLNEDGSLQQSFGYFPNLRRIKFLMLFIDNLPLIRDYIDSIHVRSEKRYAKAQKVDWVTGAFILLKKEVFEKTGGFDENYFMYGEEIEWQYRITKTGFKVNYDPGVSATHLIGASSPDRAPAVIGEIEGWKYWFAKYYPGWQETGLKFVVSIGCLVRMIIKPKLGRYYKQALISIWLNNGMNA